MIIGILVVALLIVSWAYIQLKNSIPKRIEAERKDALKKARSVIKGQVSEQVAPFLPGFPYEAADLKFFGNGFDYVAIVNMAAARDSDEIIDEIVFIDIKRNTSQLSKVQKKIRDAIVDGRVAWETMKVDETTNEITVHRAVKKGIDINK